MTDHIVAGGHLRIRPFNTADTYPEQQLDNDLCQAVVAGNTVYLRGQVAQDLDTRESVAMGDPAGQAEQAMDNIELLLDEAGAHARRTSARHRVPHRHPLPRAGLPGAGRAAARASIRRSPAWWCRRWPGPNGWSRST